MELCSLSAEYTIIRNPVLMMFGVMYYLWFVGFCLFMRDFFQFRFPYTKQVLLVHNVVSIVSNVYIFFGILYEIYTREYRLYGNELDLSHTALTHYLWVFHLTKYYEYMDTVIMVLRNSFRQITFLHVYHHASVAIYTWLVLYNHPGGDFYLGPLMNAFVHMLMYTYYLLSGHMSKEARKKYLWWSVYLTQIQIVQFLVNFSHSIYAIMYSPYHTSLCTYGLLHQISFIWLFGNFYLRKYNKQLDQKKIE